MRVDLEEKRIERLQGAARIQKMEKDLDENTERECISCFYDLHLSAACCNCSPDRYTCLKHANLVTCCDPENRLVLLRHTIDELKTLVEALEGSIFPQRAWVSNDHRGRLGQKNLSDSILAAHNKLFGADLSPPMKSECVEDSTYKVSSADSDPEQRTNVCVELITLGSVVNGKLWSNKKAIFPLGYKSRVMFYNICNPLVESRYTSEVMAGGLLGPLFKVTLDELPQVSFVHMSAEECWSSVCKRLNQEIQTQRSLGKEGLPPVQPPGSISGLEMFGFNTPSVMQAIEALDPHHKSTEYWGNKALSNKSSSSTGDSLAAEKNSLETRSAGGEITDSFEATTEETRSVFGRLLRKANREEMEMLHRILCRGSTSSLWRVAIETLTEEIQRNSE